MREDQDKKLKMKQKAFFTTFKGFPLKQIKPTFLEDESPTLMVLN